MPPNVIVLVSDTFRPDHLSANRRGKLAETPELDAFLERSVTFEGASVSSFPTIPTRADWFTGRFGATRYGWRDLDPGWVTLPAVLGANGYSTQLIADTTHLLRAGFWRPFQHFDFLRGHEGDSPVSRINDPIRPVVSDPAKTRVEFKSPPGRPGLCDYHAHTNFRQRYEDEAHCAGVADAACRWVEDNHRGGPFFLWVDFFDVHEPWFPPDYLLRRYQPDYDGEPMAHPNYAGADAYSLAELANMQARYAAMCTLLSKHVGRILRVAGDCGLFENSIVVFMSDHGMYLGEHGRTGKTLICPEASDTVPFHPEISDICWSMSLPPGMGGLEPGSRRPDLIQAPDLMPTVLDLCALKAPEAAEFEGFSFGPLLRGETDAGPREIAVTTSSTQTSHDAGFLYCRRPAVTDGTWTLLVNEPPDPAPPELYRNEEDPEHGRNLFPEHREEAVRLHEALLDYLRRHDAPASALERLSAARTGLS